MSVHLIDLHFLENLETIAAFAVPTEEGVLLIETGPYSTFEYLKKGLEKLGYSVSDVKHVAVTHIHFDHAGAAWALAELGAKVYVHPFGYPHLLDPTKLYESAKRIYKDDMDRLWSIMKPIPQEQLVAVENEQVLRMGNVMLRAWHTPGHAHHHIAWQWNDTLFTGDVAGVKIGKGPVVAPCPPPDIDIEKWEQSLQRIRSLQPKKLLLTHYGEVTHIDQHLNELSEDLHQIAQWVRQRLDQLDVEQMTPLFDNFVRENLQRKGVDSLNLRKYQAANPAWMSVAGLIRYWKKKSSSS